MQSKIWLKDDMLTELEVELKMSELFEKFNTIIRQNTITDVEV